MKVIIIDDEQKSINNLRKLIENYCPTINSIDEALNITDAELKIRRSIPDIVFLDIEMPNGNGMELLDRISDLSVNIIFITAFETYALEAFRRNAIDYLLKPIDVDYLIDSIRKVSINLNKDREGVDNTVKTKLSSKVIFSTNKLKLPTMNGFELIDTSEIIFAKSSGNYTHLFLKNDKTFIISKNIGEIEKILTIPEFLRIHNEHIVNINEIVRYIKGRGGYVILKNNQHLDVAFRRKKLLLSILEN